MTAISVSERLLEMAAFYTPLALTVTLELNSRLIWPALWWALRSQGPFVSHLSHNNLKLFIEEVGIIF